MTEIPPIAHLMVLNFFLMWTTLNFEGISKTKKWAKDICKGTLDIECERDWSVGLGSTFGDGHKDRQTQTHIGPTYIFSKTHF